MTREEAETIEAKLRYLYGGSASVVDLFDTLVPERNAGLYGERRGDVTVHNGKVFKLERNPHVFFPPFS